MLLSHSVLNWVLQSSENLLEGETKPATCQLNPHLSCFLLKCSVLSKDFACEVYIFFVFSMLFYWHLSWLCSEDLLSANGHESCGAASFGSLLI